MKIAIIGASGFVGKALVNEALRRNNDVLAIARNTDSFSKDLPLLKVISLDIYDEGKLSEVLNEYDVVISAYNSGWTNPNQYKDNMKGFVAIENAVRNTKNKRLIFIGGAGTLFIDGKQIIDSADFPEEIKPGALSCRDYFNSLKQVKDINWTYFAPAIEMHPGIKNGRTAKYRTGTDSPVFDANGVSKLSVEDVAVAILDETENKQFVNKQFTAAY